MLKIQKNITKLLFWAGVFIVMLGACSPEGTGFFSKGYHNTTAHYNAYFLARQKLQEVEAQIEESHQRNFNQILHIYPPLDTIMAKQYEQDLQETMKMASLAIERHKNSKWVDDSYLLVGKSRFYGREMEAAIETFKYVNTKSKDDIARQQALIFLMRTFIDEGALNNAKSVADFLVKEKLNKENERDFHLALALLYRQREEWDQMAVQMEKAIPATNKKEGLAKYHFILGQLYQQMEQPEKAYESFRQVLKSNPDYELSFYARLHMAQVANLARENDEKRIRRYFTKLLKDRKNKEYRDKIYYELGNFEMRQGNIPEAVANYKKSVAVSVNNPRQKSYAFRKLAEFYYSAGNYKASKIYYDSTATTTPADETDYAMLVERQKVMTDLVTQINVIEQQDSLIRLASMDRNVLEAYLDEVLQEEEKARSLAQRRNNNTRNTQPLAATPNAFGNSNASNALSTPQPETGGSSVWYFYNPSLVGMGQSEFVRRWGNRPLEDNWRRGRRGRDNNRNTAVTQSESRENFDSATETPDNVQERLAARRTELMESLPFAPEQQQSALHEVEAAYYNLGQIFNFQLREFDPTIDAYTGLLDRFTESEYRPEVLYNLYLLYLEKDPAKAAAYKDQLIRQHPQSTYAKTLLNPNYQREEDQITDQLKQLYARAYYFYQRDAFTRADSLLQAGLRQYPNNPFQSRLDLLRILILGKTQGIEAYQQALSSFLDNNEDEDLELYASELLQTSFKFAEGGGDVQGTLYQESARQPHYFVVVYPTGQVKSNELLRQIDTYNNKEEAKRSLKATTIVLTDKKSMIFVSQLPDKTAAMQYFRFLERNKLFTKAQENAGMEYFVISKDNFSLLYNSKDVAKYLSFFQKYYY